jgi:TolB-like protein/DNA-binding winged helix-turn-helix (wHTH) protein
MDRLIATDTFLFEGFRLGRRGGGLFRVDERGGVVPVAIGSRALDILGVLVERAGDLVSKDEFIAAVWPGTVVEDSNLSVQIAALRRVLDQGRSEGSCIQTVAGRGYRFVVPVTRVDSSAPPLSDRPSGNGAGSAFAEARVPQGPAAPSRFEDTPPTILQQRGWLRRAIPAILVGALCLLAAAFTASHWHLPWSSEARQVPPRLSIVVLPFADLGNDPNQQYFADGITEDLTTDLSRITDSFVISHSTAFTYRSKPADTKRIGRELGVRYVLEGSVQRSGSRVRVNAQLIAAVSDAHLWAERFDRDISDLFAVQNDITHQIAREVGGELIITEAARPTERPDALDYIFRARATFMKPVSREAYAEAVALLERALTLDPGSVEAQSYLAGPLGGRVLEGMTDSRAADIERADGLTRRALAAAPRSPLAHYAKGQILRAQGRYEEAKPEYEAAIEVWRNSVSAISALADCKLMVGPIEEVIPLQERALRLDPRDPLISNMYGRIGSAYLLQSHVDEAIAWLEKARDANPVRIPPHASLAAAFGLEGEIERAAAELAEARRLVGDDRFSSVARLKAGAHWGPKTLALREATYIAGFREAGMPEE